MPSRAIISPMTQSKNRSAESSNTVPRGAVRRTSAPSGTSITMGTSDALTRGHFWTPVTQIISDPRRRAICAVWTTDEVLPVNDIRMVRSSLPMTGVVISPTKWTSIPSWTRRTANIWPTSPDLPEP